MWARWSRSAWPCSRSGRPRQKVVIPIRGDGLNWPARGLVWMELRRMSNIWPGFSGISSDSSVAPRWLGSAQPCGRGERAVSGGNRRRSADPGRFRRGPGAQTGGIARKQPLLDTVARLKELRSEDQLQLARLIFLVFAPLKLQKLVICFELQLARRYRTWRGSKRGCSCGG